MKQLGFDKTRKLLEKYKLPVAKSILTKNIEQVIKAASKLNYPVVLKVSSEEIIHKSDIGLVEINITTEKQLVEAYDKIQKRISKKKIKTEGIIIQELKQGIEIIIGVKKDPQFGPAIIFGIGGIFVEIMKDTSLRLAPVNKEQALEMINEIKAHSILEGARNQIKADLNSIANLIVKISNLSQEKSIQEIDFNPIIINEKDVKIVDTRIVIEDGK